MLIVFYAAIIGILIGIILRGVMVVEKIVKLAAQTKLGLSKFHSASSDDARQAISIELGMSLIKGGIFLTLIFSICLLILLAPIFFTLMPTSLLFVYFSAACITVGVGYFGPAADQPNSLDRRFSYSKLERIIHKLFLGPQIIRQVTFDLGVALAKSRGDLGVEHTLGPIYICGLARSGTTIMLEILLGVPELASLTYRDMPFVLAPRLRNFIRWNDRSQVSTVERFHGDSMNIDLDSAEAFEEVFWLTQGAAETQNDSYRFVPPSPAILKSFQDYRLLLANRAGSQRYLSKNNANIGRLDVLLAQPSAKVVFVFRDPVAAATSLFRMHQKLMSAHASDRFIAHYMRLLGHFEFGPNCLPFDFALPFLDKALKKDQPDYWLDYWIAVHRALIPKLKNQRNIVVLAHEDLQSDPNQILCNLAQLLNIELDIAAAVEKINPASYSSSSSPFSVSQTENAYLLYEELMVISRGGKL
jgi:Sulfotransferase family